MTEGGCSTSEDGAKRRSNARITSMTTFFESSDLMRHMFDCIDKGDWQSATLVSKGWKDVSYTMPTWRKANLDMVGVDGPYMEPMAPGHSAVSRLSLMEIFVHRRHIVRFVLSSVSQDSESWADLASSMAHVQWLHLVHCSTQSFFSVDRDGEGEMEPFRMDGLPSLTFLRLDRNKGSMPLFVALHLPSLLSLSHSVFGPSHGLDLQCPKLETLDLCVLRETGIAPSLFSNLRSLKANFWFIPDFMLDGNGTELVLGACPQLTSLDFEFFSDPILTSLALDLPSLEHLRLKSLNEGNNDSLEMLRLTCPNLVHVDMGGCPRLSIPPTLMAQLTRFDGNVKQMVTRRTHRNEANHRHVIEGWLSLESLRLGGSAVDVTLVCPSLCDLTITHMRYLKTCKVVSPVLLELCVEYSPRLDVSSMIQPSLQNVDAHDCNLEEDSE